METIRTLHNRKNYDYATEGNPYSNFEYAARLVEGFRDPLDQVFAALVGIKLARLQELTGSSKSPNYESIQDTRRDLANYACLWGSYHEPRSTDDAAADPAARAK